MDNQTKRAVAEYLLKGRKIKTVPRGRRGRVRVLETTKPSNTTWNFGTTDSPKTDRQRFGRIVEQDWEPKQRSSFYW